MTDKAGVYGPSHAAIRIDEVGIRYAVFADMRLSTMCQPIFARRGGMVVPVAIAASGVAHRGGTVVPRSFMANGLTRASRWESGRILRRLHLHNLANVSDAPLALHLAVDAAEAGIEEVALEIAALVDEAVSIDLDPGRIVLDLTELALRDPDAYGGCAAMLARTGARLSVDARAMPAAGGHGSPQPHLVRLPAAWLHVLSGDPASAKLLATMTGGLRRRGIAVLADGLESASHLRLAVEAGADFMQGALLAEPAPAGAVFDEEPRSLAALLGGSTIFAFGR